MVEALPSAICRPASRPGTSSICAEVKAPGATGGSLREQVRRAEADIIFRVLKECGGDRKAAAQQLEIGLSSLYRKLEEFDSLGVTS
jgi:DNA-binding NtrC family response regulator